MNADASLEVLGSTVSMSSQVYGDPQQGKVNLQTQLNGKKYGMKMEASRNGLSIDANVVKHIIVDAKVS